MKAVSTFVLAVCSTVSFGQSFLDPGFGSGGMASSDWDGAPFLSINKVALQPDGKILALTTWNGNSAITRFLSNGTVDPSFATHGVYSCPEFSGYGALVLQPDGKIVATGAFSTVSLLPKFMTSRFLPDGTLDSSFGDNGTVITSFGPGNHEAHAIALQGDGKIVLAGTAFSEDVGVARLLPDGTPDSTFGTNGMQTWAVGTANDVAVMSNGRIVVGVTAYLNAFMAMRLLPDGSLDTSFNHIGYVKTVAGDSYNYNHAMLLQSDDKIVLGGSGQFGASADFVVVRYGIDGTLDHSFGDTGVVHIDIDGRDDDISSMAFTPDNQIQLAGISKVSNFDFALVRINSDGTVDNSFGNGGHIITDINGSDILHTVALQPDGNIVVGGSSNGPKAVLIRYLRNPLKTDSVTGASMLTRLYPNPASGVLHIQSPSLHHIMAVSTNDIMGRTFAVTRLNEQDISLDGLPPGSYLFTIHFDDHTLVTQKIIVPNMR